jgi:hypothetical protein
LLKSHEIWPKKRMVDGLFMRSRRERELNINILKQV